MQAYHYEYIPEVDLLVVVQVAARSVDFDQPHPHSLPHNHPPPHQQQEPQKYQQQHQQFGQAEEVHGSLGGGLFRGLEVIVFVVVAEVRQVQPVVEDAQAVH